MNFVFQVQIDVGVYESSTFSAKKAVEKGRHTHYHFILRKYIVLDMMITLFVFIVTDSRCSALLVLDVLRWRNPSE